MLTGKNRLLCRHTKTHLTFLLYAYNSNEFLSIPHTMFKTPREVHTIFLSFKWNHTFCLSETPKYIRSKCISNRKWSSFLSSILHMATKRNYQLHILSTQLQFSFPISLFARRGIGSHYLISVSISVKYIHTHYSIINFVEITFVCKHSQIIQYFILKHNGSILSTVALKWWDYDIASDGD